jgi:hypothetical protein
VQVWHSCKCHCYKHIPQLHLPVIMHKWQNWPLLYESCICDSLDRPPTQQPTCPQCKT